ncbi:DUF6431 domain-containing protein [Alkalihalobacillus deserti]|uniref:DUF6431 domain-containing protein n=1 Tax=Alkalihalobacillus deserti TaxID=2879466 RepID=UPI0035566D2A
MNIPKVDVNACPCCGGAVKVIGSRKRVWYRCSGEKERLVIRRLQCKECTKIHHELLDLLIPYRRYDCRKYGKGRGESPSQRCCCR